MKSLIVFNVLKIGRILGKTSILNLSTFKIKTKIKQNNILFNVEHIIHRIKMYKFKD